MSALETQLNNQKENDKDKSLDDLINLSRKADKIRAKGFDTFVGIAKWTPFVLIQIVGLAIIGLDKFVRGEWNWDYLLSAEFWNRFLTYQLALWIIGLSWFVNIIVRFIKNHKEYKENLQKIKEQVDFDHNKEEFIEKQVEVEKLIRKRYFLEQNVYRKLYKIRLKYKIKSISEFIKEGGIEHHLEGKSPLLVKLTLLKLRLRIVKRNVETLRERLTLEWQKEYLKHYKIKYPKISRGLIVGGIKASDKNGRFNDYKMNVVSTTVVNIAPSTLITTTIGFLILAFSLTFVEVGLPEVLLFFIQTILILWNTFMLITLAPSIFERTFLNVSEQRRSDIRKFRIRHDNNNENEKEIIAILNGNIKTEN